MSDTNVLEILETSAADLALKAVRVVRCREALDTAKNNLGVAKAAATIKHQDAKNQTLLKAHVATDPEVVSAEVALIKARTDSDIAKIEHEEVYNRFISARKLAGLDDDELHAIRGSTIKRSPVRDDQGNEIDPVTGEILTHSLPGAGDRVRLPRCRCRLLG